MSATRPSLKEKMIAIGATLSGILLLWSSFRVATVGAYGHTSIIISIIFAVTAAAILFNLGVGVFVGRLLFAFFAILAVIGGINPFTYRDSLRVNESPIMMPLIGGAAACVCAFLFYCLTERSKQLHARNNDKKEKIEQ
jgi:hypothetical protein